MDSPIINTFTICSALNKLNTDDEKLKYIAQIYNTRNITSEEISQILQTFQEDAAKFDLIKGLEDSFKYKMSLARILQIIDNFDENDNKLFVFEYIYRKYIYIDNRLSDETKCLKIGTVFKKERLYKDACKIAGIADKIMDRYIPNDTIAIVIQGRHILINRGSFFGYFYDNNMYAISYTYDGIIKVIQKESSHEKHQFMNNFVDVWQIVIQKKKYKFMAKKTITCIQSGNIDEISV